MSKEDIAKIKEGYISSYVGNEIISVFVILNLAGKTERIPIVSVSKNAILMKSARKRQ